MEMGRAHTRRLTQRRIVLIACGTLVATCVIVPSFGSIGATNIASAIHAVTPSAVKHIIETDLPAVPETLKHARHLIIVAGHAVYKVSGRDQKLVYQEPSWFLEPFQHGQLSTMMAHIQQGVALAAADNSSLLLFSGGETRAAAGPRSEALSYWEAAEAMRWFGASQVRGRAQLEAQARDSFENVLFSICRFRELSGRYPEKLTVVSFAFKRRRFEELHRWALRYPRDLFSFVGVDPPGISDEVYHGETSHSAKPFERDPYGCAEPELRAKRASRNPFRRSISYPSGCPELSALMSHCLPVLFQGPLPWSSGTMEK